MSGRWLEGGESPFCGVRSVVAMGEEEAAGWIVSVAEEVKGSALLSLVNMSTSDRRFKGESGRANGVVSVPVREGGGGEMEGEPEALTVELDEELGEGDERNILGEILLCGEKLDSEPLVLVSVVELGVELEDPELDVLIGEPLDVTLICVKPDDGSGGK